MTQTTTLDPRSRRQALEQMAAEELDVLVIGGGVTGAGAALDAVTRGLRVGLVEARDYAAGTSSRSSKLVPRRPALPRAAQLRPGASRRSRSARWS